MRSKSAHEIDHLVLLLPRIYDRSRLHKPVALHYCVEQLSILDRAAIDVGRLKELGSMFECSVCGGRERRSTKVLWDSLINEWQITPQEVAYIDRQQGEACAECASNLRSIALTHAILSCLGANKTLVDFVADDSLSAKVSILEINEAGSLHPILKKMQRHVFGEYPHVDMHALPYADSSFDIVVHSDTLEHIPNPTHALCECLRVVKPLGHLCYTVPVIVGRMTRDRTGAPKSFHGAPSQTANDYVVHTEFGADFWTFPIAAGFHSIEIFSVEFPCATAIKAQKPTNNLSL